MANNNHRGIEIGTGLFVLLGFAALLFLTTQLPSSGLKLTGSSCRLSCPASFDNVGDLKVGSPVTMAGVRVGRVDAIGFDSRGLQGGRIDAHRPALRPDPGRQRCRDPDAGLLGGKYVGLTAGGSETYLKDGGRIELTQSALVLENLVNKLFSSFAGKSGATTEAK